MGKTSQAVTRLVPRGYRDQTPVARLKSDDIRADIHRLDADREAAVAAVERLERERDAVLLLDDDAKAEAHDAETARQRRAIERCDLKRPGLERTLADVQAHEEAERKQAARQAAEAAIAAVLDDLNTGYVEPAKTIAAFMERYTAANDMAAAAGVETIDRRIRFKAGFKEPDRVENMRVFIDESGHPTTEAYGGAMQYSGTDAAGYRLNASGQRYPKRREDIRPMTIGGKEHAAQFEPSLASRVSLPGARLGDAYHWRANGLTEAEPVRNRVFL